ncbi:MAG TPA: YbhN family protein [Acidimicrobiales bacterium]|nr:YbhN family protein [Acidimicrobiales bacterium]
MPWTRWIGTCLGVAALSVFVFVERNTLRQSVHVFGHLRWDWALLAIAAETVSMGAFALAQRHLVVVAGHGTRVRHAVHTAYAGNAISSSIPFVGAQVGTVFTFRAYRRHGVDGPTIAWALAIAGVLSALAYGIVAGTGAVLSGSTFVSGAIAGSTGIILLGSAFGWWALRRQSWRPRITRRAVRLVTWRQRVMKQSFGRSPAEIVAIAFERFDALRPRRADYAAVFTYTLVNILADLSALAVSIVAVGAGVPWTRLILVWVAGSTAKGIPFTPGGAGFVESAIALALVGSGVHAATATAAALLYRVVSFWLLIALGWLAVALRAFLRRSVPATTDAVAAPSAVE